MKKRRYSLFESINFAIRGVVKAVKKERNLKIHLLASVLVSIVGILLKISTYEWLLVIILIISIISTEIMNSAVEAACNLIRDRLNLSYYETYWIRNFSAGAVIVLSAGAVIIGLIIFIPKIINLF
jgi:undecaprenol kinase